MSDKKHLKKTVKTKKNKRYKKSNLWKIIDDEEENSSEKIEIIYEKDNVIETNICQSCQDPLYFSEGFLLCSNNKCGRLYKDMIDFSAEWRYYGAEDNNMADPTRCGMPINPLLIESSFGCKVMCGKSSSYEMRKIKRYTEWQSMPYKEK